MQHLSAFVAKSKETNSFQKLELTLHKYGERVLAGFTASRHGGNEPQCSIKVRLFLEKLNGYLPT